VAPSELLAHFPAGDTPRPEQTKLIDQLADAFAEADADPAAPRVFFVEAPPGVGKSHVAMTLARWSGSAYLLTSQKLLQDQYERDFGGQLQLVKGRDNYPCERYEGGRVTTSQGMCRRPRGPACACPYARAKAAALEGPIFCTNTAYFLTLRQWQRERLDRRKLLIVDEAHNLEAQLVGVFTVRFAPEQMAAWFGARLPRLPSAEAYREILSDHTARLEMERAAIERALENFRPLGAGLVDDFLSLPPTREELALLGQRDMLDSALARLSFFLDAEDQEWIVRYGDAPDDALELQPLTVTAMAPDLLWDAADLIVLSSAYLGRRDVIADCFALPAERTRSFASASPFPLEQRRIVYEPVGPLSKATLPVLEPDLFKAVAGVLARHPQEKGLVHAASYASARRLVRDLAARAPADFQRVIFVESAQAKGRALEQHRLSPLPTVLLSPSLREGVDLPDDFLRFQIITKMPFPDLGDPWTRSRQERDPRWYALETAKALVQAYGRSCRHAADHGVTYVLDAQFSRFLQRYRPLLPEWFRDAAHAALREHKLRGGGDDVDPAAPED
jgi:ATP-dependent DNA helicase DinG